MILKCRNEICYTQISYVQYILLSYKILDETSHHTILKRFLYGTALNARHPRSYPRVPRYKAQKCSSENKRFSI